MIIECEEYSIIEGDFGGGGGSAPHKPVEANDTLASKQTLKMLFAVSEGEVSSVDQIYVNGTPFSSFEGSSQIRLGTISQAVITGFEDVETPVSVSVTLVSGTYITRSVSSSTVDAVRVTLKLQGLSQTLTNGDRVGYAVQYQIETRPVAGTGTWTVAGTINKSGKASSIYGWNTRVNKPIGATGVWEFRVVRTTAADTTSQSSITVFDSYTEIIDKTITYPGTALVGLTFTNADQVGGRIPTISFDVKGMKIKVPDAAHYNPVTRVYTGTWLGAFDSVYQYTDNPAWILYNILTTDLDFIVSTKTYKRGLGIPATQIDAFSFYDLAVYCDALVSDGHAGTEPRFIIANQFYVRENAPTFLAYILTICNANLTTRNGLITVVSDRPTAVSKLVVNANVIDGNFNYPGSSLDDRYTAVNVTFNDPDDKFNTRTITELAPTVTIDRYGFNPIDIVLVGCRSEGQARRKAKWVLQAPTATVNFSVGIQGNYYSIGEVLNIMDRRYAAVEGQGLIAVATTTTITLDRPITLGASTYSVMVYASDGVTILEKIINESSATVSVITMTTALSSAPAINTAWIIKGPIQPRPFRVSTVTKKDNQFDIVATYYDSAKFSSIESGVVVTPQTGIFKNVDEFFVSPVSNITFVEFFRNNGITAENKIVVKWDWVAGSGEKFVPTFDVLWRRDNLPYQTLPSRQVQEAEILDTTPGIYQVIIYAVNIRGIRSTGTIQTYTYHTTAATSTLIAPTDLWVKSTVSTTYNDSNLSVTWTYPAANDTVSAVLLDYLIEVWDSSGITKKNTYVVKYNSARGGEFVYTLAMNVADFATTTRNVQLKLYSRDLIGNISTPAAKTFTNPVPAAPSFTVTSGIGIAYVNITPPADLDVKGYIIYRSTVTGFTPGSGNQVYDGPDTYVSLDSVQGTLYYYRVAAYDTFDKTGLNIATQQSSTTVSVNGINWTLKSGLVFTPNIPGSNQVSWTSGVISENGSTDYTISSGTATWSSGVLYIYFDKITSIVALQTTTTLATAVATNNYPLATYKGGTDLKGGDGSAFISGSQIIAGTVGASQLVVGSAVITGSAQIANSVLINTHIVNGTIDYGKISDTLQSTNWNTTSHTGWRLNQTGGITAHDLTILDSTGATVLASGSKVDFSNLIGSTKPDNNATAGANFLTFVAGTLTLNTTGSAGTVTVSGSPPTVTKTAGITLFDSHAYSTETIVGSGVIRFMVSDTTTGKIVGFSTNPSADATRVSVNYGILAGDTGNISIVNSNILIFASGTYSISDVFELEYIGTEVRFKKNGVTFYVSTVTAGQTFYLDSSLKQVGSSFNSVQLGTYSGLSNITGQITPTNASTFIANAAIQTAQIANAAITNAQIATAAIQTANIVDANITTLKVQGNAITAPLSAYTAATYTPSTGAYETVQSLVISSISSTESVTLIVHFGMTYRLNSVGDTLSVKLSSGLGTHYGGTLWEATPISWGASSASIIITLPAATSITLLLEIDGATLSINDNVSNRFINVLGARR